ncbi:hypothetical protein [Streptomyces sp. NPDC091371]|uniref:hypothetical protein n=1 Tax=Streptomyces sp. NPDC091371 TaxID=3155303 RepID=UPI003441588B
MVTVVSAVSLWPVTLTGSARTGPAVVSKVAAVSVFGTVLGTPTCTPTANESRILARPITDDDRFPPTPTDRHFLINFTPSIQQGVTAHFKIALPVQAAGAGQGFRLTALSDAFGTQAAPTPITVTAPGADVAVGLSAAPALRLLSPAVDYELAFTNHGPGTAQSGTVTAQLPAAVTSVSGLTDGCTFDKATRKVTCPTGTLTNGASRERAFTARIGVLTLGLPLPATAHRTAGCPNNPNPADDTAAANCLVITGLIISCSR